jgi:hypothetical protein
MSIGSTGHPDAHSTLRNGAPWGGDRWCDSESPRLEMVEDLRSKRLKVGMHKRDVMRLVGPPDYRWSRRSLEWGLGGTIDCEFLVLDFDGMGT